MFNCCDLSQLAYSIHLPHELALLDLQNALEQEQRYNIAPFYFRFPNRREVDQYLLLRMAIELFTSRLSLELG